jgi:polysaccharide biosynthesis protein PslG
LTRDRTSRLTTLAVLIVAATINLSIMCAPASAATTAKASGTGQCQPYPTPVGPGQVLGIAGGGTLGSLSENALDQRMVEIRTASSQLVRYDIDAGDQVAPGQFDWSAPDRIYRASTIIGHQVSLAILDGNPGSPTSYARFAGAAAAHFSGIHLWEIGNEWNFHNLMRPGPSSVWLYVSYLRAAYCAIKHVDPYAMIVAGALAPSTTDKAGDISPIDFVKRLYQYGAKGYFDALSIHPYSFPVLPSYPIAWNAWQQMRELRRIMVAHGDAAIKIWITEIGAPTGGSTKFAADASNLHLSSHPNHVTLAWQKAIAIQTIQLWRSYSWTGPMLWHTITDTCASKSRQECNFGLIDKSGHKKPAYSVFVQSALALAA